MYDVDDTGGRRDYSRKEKETMVEQRILEEIDKQKEKLENKIKEFENEIDQLEKERIKTYKEREEATKPTREILAAIEKPFNQKEAELESKEKAKEQSRWDSQLRLRNLEEDIRAKFAEDDREFATAEAFKGWMRSKGIELREVTMVKKPLKNGIILFRHYDGWNNSPASESDEVAYFAVKDKKIVGYHHTRKAQHIGDDTYRSCFINVKNYVYGKELHVDITAENYRRSYYSHGVRFKDWKDKLEALTTFVGVDLADEKSKETLKKVR